MGSRNTPTRQLLTQTLQVFTQPHQYTTMRATIKGIKNVAAKLGRPHHPTKSASSGASAPTTPTATSTPIIDLPAIQTSAPRVWLITGSSTGFGRETVIQALEGGDKVVATLRKPSALDDLVKQYPADRLRVVKLDVTKPEEIDAAFAQAKAAFGRVDIVFNNAGYVAVGENEAVPDDVARPLFEVNFWGAVHVSQRAVRFLREENTPQGGLLLQNSAMVGQAGVPAIGFYSATKHALEGFSESLAKEVDPAWNIKVAIIEPGAFKTSVFNLDTSMVMVPQHPAYANPALPVYNFRGAFLKGAGKEADTPADLAPADASLAVAKIVEFSRLSSPPLHFPLGKDSIGLIREKLRSLTEEMDNYESWSDNLGK